MISNNTFLNKLFYYFVILEIIMAIFIIIMMSIGIIMVSIGLQYFTYSDWVYCISFICISIISIILLKLALNQTKLEDE